MARIDWGASDGRNVQPVHNERAAVVKKIAGIQCPEGIDE